MTLDSIIKNKIIQNGPISFRDFMEYALYYPDMGYYTSTKEKLGKSGDFYTSPYLTNAFGTMIAKQLQEMYEIIGEDEFTIIEYGAGTGVLCKSILDYFKKEEKIYRKLNYCIVEKSPAMQQKAKSILNEKVSWHESIETVPASKGCILSNELVDNFSVHKVIMQNELMEVYVDHKNDFIEVLKPASMELKEYLAELKVDLPQGYKTEINLEATNWMKEVASVLQQGYVMTIDYGYPSHELYNMNRSHGTLLCYNKHKINYQPYKSIGEQDITTHVNFSALCLWGYKSGLEFCGFRDQGSFLNALGIREYLMSEDYKKKAPMNYETQSILAHILLEDMLKYSYSKKNCQNAY